MQMRRKKGWMSLRVDELVRETHDTVTMRLTDKDDGGRPFDFYPGQYLSLRFDDLAEKPVVRSYTMSGSPCQTDHIEITVKKIPGGLVSSYIVDQLLVGQHIRALGPMGAFAIKDEAQELFMIAAGSGVTPFTSIIREYGNKCPHIKMHLLVAYRSRQDLINWEVLSQSYSNVRVVTTLTRDTAEGFCFGRPDDDMLREFFNGRYEGIKVMTCGPEELMELTKNHCRLHGFDGVMTESFF
jgi:ferredoxin-NADP reductase